MTGIFPPRSRSLLAGSHPVHQQQFIGGPGYSHGADTPPINSKSTTGPRSRLPKQLHSIREHPGLESFPSDIQEQRNATTNSSPITHNPHPQVPVSFSADNVNNTGARPAYDAPNGASIAAVAAIQQRSTPLSIGHEANAAATYSRFGPHASASESEGESTPASGTKYNQGLDQVPSQLKIRRPTKDILQSHGHNGSHVHRTNSRASAKIADGASLNSQIYPVVTEGSVVNSSSNEDSGPSSNTADEARRLQTEEVPRSDPLKSKMLPSPHYASSSTTSSPAKKAQHQQLHLTDIPFATRSFANDPCVGTFSSIPTPSPTNLALPPYSSC